MSYEEINCYLEAKVEKEKDDYIRDLNLAYYTGIFGNAKDPHKIYKKVVNDLNDEEMSDEEMENMARNLNTMFGGKTVKK